jgi:hypothetical protein
VLKINFNAYYFVQNYFFFINPNEPFASLHIKLFMRSFVFMLLIFFGMSATAQPYSDKQGGMPVSGKIFSNQGKPVYPCFLKFTYLGPDSPSSRSRTDSSGFFRLRLQNPGKYRLTANAEGYNTLSDVFTFNDAGESYDLRILVMKKNDTGKIKEVLIVSDASPIRLKGDTTEHSASSYKTNPDATAEDLVGKMPGITTSNGQVQAQGENVKQVLVDGRPFFGDDPASVLRNLPAEVIDKIQVFDRKSDQAQVTGFDDGNTSKTINIITRQQFRNGSFGRANGGIGTEDRFKGNASYNRFKGARRLTLLGSANNTNDQNFSSEDLMGVMAGSGGSGGGMRGMMGGMGGMRRPGGGSYGPASPSDNFTVDQRNGITQTMAFGLNYSNKWKKSELSTSYFVNATENNNRSNTTRYYVTGNQDGLLYRETNEAETKNTNHRLNARYEWKPDTMHSFLFTPKVSVQVNQPTTVVNGNNVFGSSAISRTGNYYSADLAGYNASLGLQYNVRYKTRGRSLTLNATPGISGNNGNSSWKTVTDQLLDALPAFSNDVKANQDRKTLSGNAAITYTEPSGKYAMWSFSLNGNINETKSDKRTSAWDTLTKEYSRPDTLLSNTFKSQYSNTNAGISYRWQKQKWSWNISLNAQQAWLNNEVQFPVNYRLSKPFSNLLPGAMLMFKPSEKEGLRVFYHSSTNAPSIDQLQEVANNSNPLSISTGNSNLKQEFQHAMFSRYSWVNVKKGTSVFLMVSGTTTKNHIGNTTNIAFNDTLLSGTNIFLRTGAQLTRPENLRGNRSFRTFVNYSMPINKIKCNLNVSAGAAFSRTPGKVNNAINYANNVSPSVGLVISSNISEKVDFTLSSNTSITSVNNSLQTGLNSQFTNQNSRFRIQAQPWKGLVLQTDINHQLFKGLSGGLNNNFMLWNAGIGYKFLKKRAAEIRFTAFDLLKQNNSLSRNISETYYEDVQTNVLQRFYMVTFTYNLRAFKMPEGGEKRGSWGPHGH